MAEHADPGTDAVLVIIMDKNRNVNDLCLSPMLNKLKKCLNTR